MANISTAEGFYRLVGEWTNEMVSTLNAIAEMMRSWYFDTCISDEFSEENKEQDFSGSGRWSYSSNLSYMHDWILFELEEDGRPDKMQYEKLLSDMESKDSYIEVGFSDEESGCMFLCESVCHLRANNGKLTAREIQYTGYDYTWLNYIDVTGDKDCFQELFGNVIQKLKVKDGDERVELVRKWLEKNTYPHYWELDEDQMKSVKAYVETAA